MLFYFEKNMLGKSDAAVARAKAMVDDSPNSPIANYLLLSAYLETRQSEGGDSANSGQGGSVDEQSASGKVADLVLFEGQGAFFSA